MSWKKLVKNQLNICTTSSASIVKNGGQWEIYQKIKKGGGVHGVERKINTNHHLETKFPSVTI